MSKQLSRGDRGCSPQGTQTHHCQCDSPQSTQSTRSHRRLRFPLCDLSALCGAISCWWSSALSLLLFVTLLLPSATLAATWQERWDVGWFFEDELVVATPTPPPIATPTPTVSLSPVVVAKDSTVVVSKSREPNPLTRRDAMQRRWNEALTAAIYDPNPENLRAWFAVTEEATGLAVQFAQAVERLGWSDPHFATELRAPQAATVAQPVFYQQRRDAQAQTLQTIRDSYGILFFYRGQGAYDQVAARVLADFAKTYDLATVPLTLDGVGLDVLPHTRLDLGQAKELHVEDTPAYFLVEPRTLFVQPVGFGVLTHSDLLKRIHALVSERGLPKIANRTEDARNAYGSLPAIPLDSALFSPSGLVGDLNNLLSQEDTFEDQ